MQKIISFEKKTVSFLCRVLYIYIEAQIKNFFKECKPMKAKRFNVKKATRKELEDVIITI